jgi:hypothetical protein
MNMSKIETIQILVKALMSRSDDQEIITTYRPKKSPSVWHVQCGYYQGFGSTPTAAEDNLCLNMRSNITNFIAGLEQVMAANQIQLDNCKIALKQSND